MKTFYSSAKPSNVLLSLSKRGLFHFSPQEYRMNSRNCLSSSQRRLKQLRFKRPTDEKEVKINLYGYPICPMPQLHEDDDKMTDVLENNQNNLPDVVLV